MLVFVHEMTYYKEEYVFLLYDPESDGMLKVNGKICGLTAGMLLGLMMSGTLPEYVPVTEAAYQSYSDTDADILDGIENEHRAARENALNDDQKQLLLDAYKMKENLREPLDPTKNVPVAVEGDELVYDENTGDFSVKGNVVMTSLDKRRFITEYSEGNLLEQSVEVPDSAYMLQLTDEQARIILTGYRTQYNWGKETGQMEDANGKIDHQYVKAKRIELYPDKVVLFDASATKCSAEHPDYRMTAKRIEYYPGVETISYDVSYWLGSIPVYSVGKQVTKENEETQYMPRLTYDNDNGVGLKDTFYYPITDNVQAYWDVFLSQKSKFNSHGGFVYTTKAAGTIALRNGFFEDSDNRWIQKSPTLRWDYGQRLGQSPFSYSLAYEHGAWTQNDIHSIHTYYYASLRTDAVKLGTWRLYPSINYSITDETYNHSRISGMDYDVTALRRFDDRWATYLGYHFSKTNSQNSVFDYDLDDYSEKVTAGFSYRFSPKDRIVVGWAFDAETNTLKDTDYYWYHDMHCAELIIRYREKRDQFKVTAQFTPW